MTKLLSAIKSKFNSTDEDIFGIPLQCLLIAEGYKQNALKFSADDFYPASTVNFSSIIVLYERLMQTLYSKSINRLRMHDTKPLQKDE